MSANKGRVGLLVAALRSGLYKQGRGSLHLIDGEGKSTWCCLGVAADVASKFGCNVPRVPVGNYGEAFGAQQTQSYLVPEVAAWYGITDIPEKNITASNPFLLDADGQHNTAINMNDSYGNTFEEIADAFERTYVENGTEDVS